MKDAVRLSKRWRYLYASTSNIEFSFGQSTNAINVPLIDAMNSVDRVFSYRNRCSSSINSFQISWDDGDAFDPLRLQGWINCVMWHGIRKIDICIPANLMLPASLFTCETLAELHLSMISGPVLDVPAKVCLPSLKVLELTNVISFPYDDVASERLLTNCPLLEDLSYSSKDRDCKLVVCHPTLKRLTITHETGLSGGTIWINAPSLVYLRYWGFDVESYTLINAQNLVEADISFLSWFYEEQYTLCATNLMRGFSHVRKLAISGGLMIENLVENHVQTPVFNNLTCLEISEEFGEGSSRFENILCFLESLNCLETLYFMDLPSEFDLDAWYAQEESTASCLSFRLKRIHISWFYGSDEEMDMVKYLLQSARVLEVLDVGTSAIESCEKRLDVCKRLRMLPIASSKCGAGSKGFWTDSVWWSFLKNQDWTARKAAAEALGKIAAAEMELALDYEIICLKALENRRFDKVPSTGQMFFFRS